MNNIKNIIFDYGAVLFNINHQLTIEAFKQLGMSDANAFFGHLQQNELFDEFEVGAISPQEFRDSIRKIIHPDLTDEQIDDAWNRMLLGIPQENLDLLTKLKSKYRTFLLSNNNEIHYGWIIDHLKKEFNVEGMVDYFEKDYYSHLMQMRKPNADIFEYVLKKHHLDPSETFFIDDSPQHIATAKKLGIHTYLMRKEDKLQDVLSQFL